MPLITEQARRNRIDNALKSLPGDAERILVPWQNSVLNLPVIKVSLDTFLLNPNSHRIRAQLESHPQRYVVEDAPFSEKSQEIITEVLRSTEDFDRLKTNLAEEGQREAGVATRAGLLINGNTRAAAMRDIRGQDYFRAAVLPSDATEQEINELELRLQMKIDLKQEYTFTNELLFVEELISRYNYSNERIALDLRWATSRVPKELDKGKELVCRSVRILSLIRQIQELSQGRLPLTFFDRMKQHLIEIDAEYQQARDTDPAKAAVVRDTRMIGVLVGLGYREMRQIDDRFLEDYLVPVLSENIVLGTYVDALTEQEEAAPMPPGLDILPTETSGSDRSPEKLLRLLALSRMEENVSVPTDAGEVSFPREQVVDIIRGAMEEAADTAKLNKRTANQRSAPIIRLETADRELRVALEAYQARKNDPALDHDRIKRLFARIRRTVEAFADELASPA